MDGAHAMTVTVSGPFFAAGALALVKDAIDEAVREVSEKGAENVQEHLYAGHGVRTGKFRASITGQLTPSRHGIVFARDAVKGPWLEGTSRRNLTTRFKGFAMFRRGRDRTDRQAQAIADKIIGNLVRKLD